MSPSSTATRANTRPSRGRSTSACCIGATWIGGGLAGTVDLLRPAIRDGGRILIGEPYWIHPPPDEAVAAHDFAPDEFVSLEGTLDRLEAAGLELVEMVLASPDDWDRYEARQWRTIVAWLAANPDDPDHEAMRRFLDDGRRAYLRWYRRLPRLGRVRHPAALSNEHYGSRNRVPLQIVDSPGARPLIFVNLIEPHGGMSDEVPAAGLLGHRAP